MDKNLERNLMKIEALRAKGDLAKARRKLTELTQEHPDTPDYRLELARICLELGDSLGGLLELRQLGRQAPDRRAEALAVVEAHFQATADTHSGQFLLEDHLVRGDGDGAMLVLERLAEPRVRQLLERYEAKIRSITGHGAEPDAPAAAAKESPPMRLAHWGSFHCALALKQPETAAAHAFQLLCCDETAGKCLLAVLERRARSVQIPPPLLAVLGEARVREGRAVDGLSALLGAAERDRTLLPLIEGICSRLSPLFGELPAALRARGHLARLSGRHDEAIGLYREAIAREPQGIRSLLELITPPQDTPDTKVFTLFRIELLARLGDGGALAKALEQLRQIPWIDPRELHAIIAPYLRGADVNPALVINAATLAASTGDAAGMEELLPACARLPRDQIGPVARAIEERLGLPTGEPELVTDPITGEMVPADPTRQETGPGLPAAERDSWLRLLARLRASVRDAAGANACLAQLWAGSTVGDSGTAGASGDGSSSEGATAHRATVAGADLLAFTREILSAVRPTSAMLRAALPVAAARGELPELLPWFAAISEEDAEVLREVERTLTDLVLADEAHARALCAAQPADRPAAGGALALPLATARLRGDEAERGLRELSALVADRPDLEGRDLEILLACCRSPNAPAAVALAAARLLRLEDRVDEAVAVLRPALERDPTRAEEICLFFESVLADEPEHSELWLSYLDGLLRAGRWRRLAQLLPEAERRLPAAEIGRLRVYRARLLFEGGDLTGALSECELVLQLADPPLDLLEELLRSALAVNPGLARAHRLLGTVAFAAGRFEAGLRCCAQALRCDPALQAEILHAVRRLVEKRVRSAADCLALARFYLDSGRGDDAAAAYQEVLQADPACAAAVATDLHDAAESASPFLALLQPLAQALRLAGRLEDAEAAYTRLYARDPARVDWIFRELAQLETAFPDALMPERARARILLAEKRLNDLERLVVTALERPGRADQRWQLAREFAGALAQSQTVPLLAAAAAAETGRREPALVWLRGWAARRDRLDGREYERAVALLDALGQDPEDWPEREVRFRVHLLGGRADRAFAVLPGPAGLADDVLAAAWQALESLPEALDAAPAVRLQRARYLAALGRPEHVLVALDGLAFGEASPADVSSDIDPREARREAIALRTQALAALGRHTEAQQAIRDLLRAPEAQAEALAALRQTHAAEAAALTASRGGAAALSLEERRTVAASLAHAGRIADGLRLLAAPCADPAQEQARRVAEAQLLALDDRPLEALERLRAVPLTGEECLLAPAARTAALWLRAHGEETRGRWAAACACYRALGALPDDPESARQWWSWSYGRLLEDSATGTSLVLEKTVTLV